MASTVEIDPKELDECNMIIGKLAYSLVLYLNGTSEPKGFSEFAWAFAYIGTYTAWASDNNARDQVTKLYELREGFIRYLDTRFAPHPHQKGADGSPVYDYYIRSPHILLDAIRAIDAKVDKDRPPYPPQMEALKEGITRYLDDASRVSTEWRALQSKLETKKWPFEILPPKDPQRAHQKEQ
jgi:hypothetical protein